MGIDLSEFLPDLPGDHIAILAARLRVAARAALPAVAADDAAQQQLAAEYVAQFPVDDGSALQEALAAHEKATKEAMRRGMPLPQFQRPEQPPPNAQFTRPIVVDVRRIKAGPVDPRRYLEPYEQSLLDVRERRTTLQAERRDLERLAAAADARIAATMTEAADLVEAMYLGCEPAGMPERANIGPGYVAFTKLKALTTEDYALLIWERAVAHWKRQIFEDED